MVDQINIGNFSGWRKFEKSVDIPVGTWEFYILVESFDPFKIGIDSVHLYVDDGRDYLGGSAENLEKYYYVLVYAEEISSKEVDK